MRALPLLVALLGAAVFAGAFLAAEPLGLGARSGVELHGGPPEPFEAAFAACEGRFDGLELRPVAGARGAFTLWPLPPSREGLHAWLYALPSLQYVHGGAGGTEYSYDGSRMVEERYRTTSADGASGPLLLVLQRNGACGIGLP